MSTWVADIGGTSSRWAKLCRNAAPEVYDGLPGFNPVSGDPAMFKKALAELDGGDQREADECFIYGAGCGSPEGERRMREVLGSVWPGLKINVETDMLGAARSLYGSGQGMVLILGTGMNCGFHDGARMQCPMPSLGFVLGDEGSGADLGKHLLKDALLGRISLVEAELMFPEGIDRGRILQLVYRSPSPQAELASFAKRLTTEGVEDYADRLVGARFMELGALVHEFFPDRKWSGLKAVGSVAWGFRERLHEALGHYGFRLTDVVKDPMGGLLRYHSMRPH